jgi:hypothetical protein
MSAVLFQCHEVHQCPTHSHGKSCCKCSVSCAWSFPYLRHQSALLSFHSSTMPSVHSVHFLFYPFTVYAVIFRNTTLCIMRVTCISNRQNCTCAYASCYESIPSEVHPVLGIQHTEKGYSQTNILSFTWTNDATVLIRMKRTQCHSFIHTVNTCSNALSHFNLLNDDTMISALH